MGQVLPVIRHFAVPALADTDEFRETGDRRREAEALGDLGLVQAPSGGREEDGTAFTEAAALFRETGGLDDERRALEYRAAVRNPADGRRRDTGAS
ncbi:hypothetical protein GCM10010206_50420 [Streptomyces cinerochromogenes]|nr:hypothetical protein GCM10010206_50420 [Streptomyces cinerochromogenes]